MVMEDELEIIVGSEIMHIKKKKEGAAKIEMTWFWVPALLLTSYDNFDKHLLFWRLNFLIFKKIMVIIEQVADG